MSGLAQQTAPSVAPLLDGGRITVGALIMPLFGDVDRMREAWVEAESLGADAIYASDHFLIPRDDEYGREGVEDRDPQEDPTAALEPKTFEAMTIQAAMAATTTRAAIGCTMLCGIWRNPNLLADMARTVDHVAGGGRYVLGLGAGYLQREFEDYGFPFASARERWDEIDRIVPIIRDRWRRLVPAPVAPIPVMIGAKGERVALRVVARHADIWHCLGSPELLAHKAEVLERWCAEVGRPPTAIARATSYNPLADYAWDPDACLELGFRHFVVHVPGPDWPLDELRETLAWRDQAQRSL